MPSYSRGTRYLHSQVSAVSCFDAVGVVVVALVVVAVVVVADVVVVSDHKKGSPSGSMPSYARGS